ncbi:MAG TPA: PadR family transcriptional regulator [Sphingomicrobium sp.]|nr:PadR family transcriptional regulator [Sphingomicrobium sp.]
MNARLLVLGVLHRGNLHPYEIKRRLETAMVECYLDVDVGTLYYAVRQLEKEALIVPVAEERVPRGGVRTIYRITAKGRTEFRNGLHRQLMMDGPVLQTLYGALLFLQFADRSIVEKSLRSRITKLDELISKLPSIRRELAPKLSTGGANLLDHIDRQRRLDRRWLKALLVDIETNGIRDIADPLAIARSSLR